MAVDPTPEPGAAGAVLTAAGAWMALKRRR